MCFRHTIASWLCDSTHPGKIWAPDFCWLLWVLFTFLIVPNIKPQRLGNYSFCFAFRRKLWVLQYSGCGVPSSLDDFQAVIETTFCKLQRLRKCWTETQAFCFSLRGRTQRIRVRWEEEHPRSCEVKCQCCSCCILSMYVTSSTRHLDLCSHLMNIQVVSKSWVLRGRENGRPETRAYGIYLTFPCPVAAEPPAW